LAWNAQAEYSATWEQEAAIDQNGGQKFETRFEPEWNINLADTLEMTFIGLARVDGYDNLGFAEERPENYSPINGPLITGTRGDLAIREWFIDAEVSDTYFRIGKQQVVWGQADGLKVLDVVNPQSYREFILDDFEDSRIPLWTMNVEIPVGESDSLQLLWIPDLTYNEFAQAGATYEITSPLLVPELPESYTLSRFDRGKPSSVVRDSDAGVRYMKFYDGWDLTFNYLYHYHDTPVLYQVVDNTAVSLDSRYERNHLLGGTASKAFGDFTLRAEVGYSSDTYHLMDNRAAGFVAKQGIHVSDDLSSVIGLDWQGLEDTMLSVQWFQSYLFEDDPGLVRPRQNHLLSLLYRGTFKNEAWQLEALTLYGLDQEDTSVQVQLSHMWQSNIEVRVGFDLFFGPSESLFGQFAETDRITLGFEWGF